MDPMDIYGCGILIQIVDVDYWCTSNNIIMIQLPLLFLFFDFIHHCGMIHSMIRFGSAASTTLNGIML